MDDTSISSMSTAVDKTGPRSGFQKIISMLKTAVVEPFFILFMFSYVMGSVSFQEIVQIKVCLNHFGYNETVCGALTGEYRGTDVQLEIQRMTTNITMGKMIMTMIPSIIAVIFVGSFGDKYGRKVPIIVATTGVLLENAGIYFCLLNMNSSPVLLLLPSIPSALTGGIVVALTMAMSHLGTTTEPENRAMRYAFMEMSFILGAPAGGAFGGFIRDRFDFKPVFLCSVCIMLLAIIWIVFRFKEPNRMKITSFKQGFKDLFTLRNIWDNLRTSFKKRPGNARKQIWFLYLAICANVLIILGIANIGFMYVQLQYGWKNLEYSLLNTITSVLQGLALAITVPLLTKVLNSHDCVLIIIGSASTIANMLFRAFALKPWMFIVGCLAGLAGGLTSIGIRSRLSNLVERHEIGKIFSVMALCESLTPIIGSAIWTQMYNASVDFYPGLSYLCAAFLDIIPVLVALWVFLRHPEPPNLEDLSSQELVEKTEDSPLEETTKY